MAFRPPANRNRVWRPPLPPGQVNRTGPAADFPRTPPTPLYSYPYTQSPSMAFPPASNTYNMVPPPSRPLNFARLPRGPRPMLGDPNAGNRQFARRPPGTARYRFSVYQRPPNRPISTRPPAQTTQYFHGNFHQEPAPAHQAPVYSADANQYQWPTSDADALPAPAHPEADANQYQWSTSDADALALSGQRPPPLPEESPVGFVPIALTDEMLAKVSKFSQHYSAAMDSMAQSALESKGWINVELPKELKSMFQPLYCKLCSSTLTSNIVAQDHYTGRKHRKKIDIWLLEHADPGQVVKALQAKTSVAAAAGGGGARKRAEDKGIDVERAMVKKRLLEHQRETIRTCFGGVPVDDLQGQPPEKKIKSFPTSCEICGVIYKSLSDAEQHLNGKPHAKAAKKAGIPYNMDDRTFGIGKAFLQATDQASGELAAPVDPDTPEVLQK